MGFLFYENLAVVQGVAYPSAIDPTSWTWRSGTKDPVTGLPPAIDLTGYTANLKIRASRDASAAALVSLTQADGITLGGVAGTVAVALSAARTAALPAGTCFYDLVLTPPVGNPVPFVAGEVRVEPWIGRP